MKRVKKACKKAKKANHMFTIKQKKMNIVRSFPSGAMRYSATRNGVPPKAVSTVRPQLYKSIARNTGGSATIVFALQKNRWVDPWYDASTLAPIAWAKHVYSRNFEVNGKQRKAWEMHKTEILMATDPWLHVREPVTATFASIRRYGWAMPAWHSFVDKDGIIWDMRFTIPYLILQKLRLDISDKLWNDAMRGAGFDYDAGTPWMPTMRKCTQGNDADIVGYRQLLQGSQWSMQRHFLAGMVDANICQACQQHIGTEEHMGE